MNTFDFTAACIIPTGVGASIGGFAGDASPYINLLSKVCPIITNPNSINAAVFSGINDNIFYVEGLAIDLFFKGELALRPSKYNKIGVLFDKAISEKVLNVHINTINAVKSTYGMNITGYKITKEAVGVEFFVSESGISTGKLNNPDSLIETARELIDAGAEAIAAVCFFEIPENDEQYSLKGGVDPVGGVEAVISHILTEKFKIPVAHAPAFVESELIIGGNIVDKRVAAEYITPTFLPCILKGLYNAPKLITKDKFADCDITVDSVKALIMPYDCLGGLPVFAALQKNIPVIAVQDNKTVLDITPETLGIEDKIITARNYQEAAGLLLAMKNGIWF